MEEVEQLLRARLAVKQQVPIFQSFVTQIQFFFQGFTFGTSATLFLHRVTRVNQVFLFFFFLLLFFFFLFLGGFFLFFGGFLFFRCRFLLLHRCCLFYFLLFFLGVV